METERPNPRFSRIDEWPSRDVLDALIEGQLAAVAAVRAARPAIESAAIAIESRLRHHGRLVYAGAGTSGRLAVQDGAELMPTFGWPKERLLLLMAGGKNALLHSIEGAEDQVAQAEELIGAHSIGSSDVLIAVAASGTTAFTLACLHQARQRGALTVGIANNRNTPILTDSDQPIWLDTGTEPIAGSTRMNAGTAQRITLSVLSTLVMIMLGRVYEGLMVEMRAVNKKLVLRSARILVRLSGCSEEAARDALAEAQGNIKIALLLLHGCTVSEAQALLDRAGGRLRPALGALGKSTRSARGEGRISDVEAPSIADDSHPPSNQFSRMPLSREDGK
jgi:N-acetylmuramic acid 6-phosphate etherase